MKSPVVDGSVLPVLIYKDTGSPRLLVSGDTRQKQLFPQIIDITISELKDTWNKLGETHNITPSQFLYDKLLNSEACLCLVDML